MWQNVKYIVDISVFTQDTRDIMGAGFLFEPLPQLVYWHLQNWQGVKIFDKDGLRMLFLS